MTFADDAPGDGGEDRTVALGAVAGGFSRRHSLIAGIAAVVGGGIAGAAAGGTMGALVGNSSRPALAPGNPFLEPASLYVCRDGDDHDSGESPARALQTIDAALARLKDQRGVVRLCSGETLQITSPIRLDAALHRIVGESTVLDGSGLGGRSLFEIYGSIPQPIFQPWAILENLELQGPGRDTDSRGLYIHTPISVGKASVAHSEFRNLAIRDFGVGVEFGDNAYCLTFLNCMIGKVGTCVLIGPEVDNTGERLAFTSCTIFDSDIGFHSQSRSVELSLVSTSVDYCRTLLRAEEGRINLVNSHLEFNKSREDIPLETAGSTGGITMIGGKFTATTKSGPISVPYILANDADRVSGSQFIGVWMSNLATTTGDFSSGPGYTNIQDEVTWSSPARSFAVVGSANNLVADGSFTESELVDTWFVLSAGRDAMGRGEPATLSLVQVGDRSALQIRSNTVRGQFSEVAVAIAIPRSSIVRARMLWRAEPSLGRAVVSFESAIVSSGQRPAITKSSALGASVTVDLASPQDEWSHLRTPLPVDRAQPWATHLVIRFSLTDAAQQAAIQVTELNVCAT